MPHIYVALSDSVLSLDVSKHLAPPVSILLSTIVLASSIGISPTGISPIDISPVEISPIFYQYSGGFS